MHRLLYFFRCLSFFLVLLIPYVVSYCSLFNLMHFSFTGPLLAWYAPIALFFALFVVSTSMLQGINEQNFALVSLGVGLFLKAMFNITFIHFFEAKGAVFGTALGVGTAVMVYLWIVKHFSDFCYL